MSFCFKLTLGIIVLLGASPTYSDSEPNERQSEHKNGSKIIQMFPGLVEIAKKFVPVSMRYKPESARVEPDQTNETPRNGDVPNVFKKNYAKQIVILLLVFGLIYRFFISNSNRVNGKVSFNKNSNSQDSKKSDNRPVKLSDLEESFKMLGLNTSASVLEITRAYRRLMVKHHPDKYANSSPKVIKQAEKLTKQIILAKGKCLKAAKKSQSS